MAETYLETVYNEELYLVPAKVTLLITQPWDDLAREEKEQLTKITEALRQRIHPSLSLSAFNVTTVDTLDLNRLLQRPDKVIYFGPAVSGLTRYEIIQAAGTKLVLSEKLSELIVSEASRTRLWAALKLLFAA